MKHKPLKINGMNLDPGPRNTSGVGPEFFDPHLKLWLLDGSPCPPSLDGCSDLDLVKEDGYNTVRWGLLPGDVWGDGWSVEATRVRPVLDEALRLGLRVIYPVWWTTDEERKNTLEKLLPILEEHPNVIPQPAHNEWMDPNGKSKAPWETVKAQGDAFAAEWRVIAPGRPWIAPQVCPLQDGSLGIDWVSLDLHAETWEDAYVAAALYGEDGVRYLYPEGVQSDVVDLRDLLTKYGNRIVVTEHGRSRTEFKAEWREQADAAIAASQDADLLNAAPMPNISGAQYKWRHYGQPTDKHAQFSVMPVQVVGVEA